MTAQCRRLKDSSLFLYEQWPLAYRMLRSLLYSRKNVGRSTDQGVPGYQELSLRHSWSWLAWCRDKTYWQLILGPGTRCAAEVPSPLESDGVGTGAQPWCRSLWNFHWAHASAWVGSCAVLQEATSQGWFVWWVPGFSWHYYGVAALCRVVQGPATGSQLPSVSSTPCGLSFLPFPRGIFIAVCLLSLYVHP